MAKGKVKWWDNKKGLGFIAQEAGQETPAELSARRDALITAMQKATAPLRQVQAARTKQG